MYHIFYYFSKFNTLIYIIKYIMYHIFYYFSKFNTLKLTGYPFFYDQFNLRYIWPVTFLILGRVLIYIYHFTRFLSLFNSTLV